MKHSASVASVVGNRSLLLGAIQCERCLLELVFQESTSLLSVKLLLISRVPLNV